MALSVSLERSELSLDPGGSVRVQVRVANRAATADRVRLAVTGAAAAWAWVVPPELDVPAGGEALAGIGFRVPRSSEVAAGRHDFVVLAASSREPGVEGTVTGSVTVTRFVELAVVLQPADAADPSVPRQVSVANRGNVPLRATLSAISDDPGVDLELDPDVVTAEPGTAAPARLTVRAGGRPLLSGRTQSFVVTAVPDDAAGASPATVRGTLAQGPVLAGRTVGLAALGLAVVLVVAGLVAVSGGGDDTPSMVAASGTTASSGSAGAGAPGAEGRCPVDGHIDPRVTGLERDDIPTLPPDFSFFEVAADACTPVRWNPCEPVHFIINPANAPPTGVADVREAFRRLAEVTGMTYVDDGMTDEGGTGGGRGGRAAYQPDRYPGRWAPILVHWEGNTRGTETIQIVGGGFPTRSGDVYVTGNLFLNPFVVTNAQTRTTVAGGFGADDGAGAIGPEGVTWGRIILHELAHITGLGHVRDPAQLMYPETSEHVTRPARFESGDLAGLRHLSKEAGCLTTPPPGSPTRGISRGGGQGQPAPTAPTLSPQP